MRSRSSSSSSSKQGGANKGNGGSMDNQLEKLKKLKEEPHLSGAYIRSLVKQLTSSRTKDPINPKLQEPNSDGSLDDHSNPQLPQNLNKISDQTHQSQQSQQPKKQVRRRLHTSRPYQERLLNMAEARREIVTALKFHRASMKQANEQQQHQQQQQQQQQPPINQSLQTPSSPNLLEPEQDITKCRRNPRIYPSNTTTTNNNCSNYYDNLSYSSSFSCHTPSFPPNPLLCGSSCSPYLPTLPIIDNLNLNLPNQPLGLNLNFQDFNNLDTSTLYYNNNNNNNQNQNQFSIYSYSSPSSSSLSPTLGSTEEAHSFVTSSPEEPPLMTDMTDMSSMLMNEGLHPRMDDDEMAEIRSIGEQHEMQWNDTLNLVTSAWWFKFLKKMEISPDEMRKKEGGLDQDDDHGFNNNLFDEVMEFPAWMNANNESSSFLQQHLDDYYSEDYLHQPALPCMDIGEIDGMDGEWLA